MDDLDLAQQLEKSLLDAVNNDQHDLAEKLRDALHDVNERIVLGGFAPVVVEG
jgi:hypothetical protein